MYIEKWRALRIDDYEILSCLNEKYAKQKINKTRLIHIESQNRKVTVTKSNQGDDSIVAIRNMQFISLGALCYATDRY